MALKRFTKPRFLVVYPVVGVLFWTAHITERSLQLGAALVAAGETLRLWANGYVGHVKVNWTQRWRGDAKIGRLITAGPYAFVRHPLYLGTLLIGAGFCMIAGYVWASLLVVGCFALTYRAKMAKEERLLSEECGAAYHRYQDAVPRLLPTWRRYAHREGQWSWQGITASKEWKTAIWVAVFIILFYFWEESIQEREWLFEERRVFRLWLLGALLGLILCDGLLELVRARARSAAPVKPIAGA